VVGRLQYQVVGRLQYRLFLVEGEDEDDDDGWDQGTTITKNERSNDTTVNE
jgi:hypothetical protein